MSHQIGRDYIIICLLAIDCAHAACKREGREEEGRDEKNACILCIEKSSNCAKFCLNQLIRN